jgi:hypothetical protein
MGLPKLPTASLDDINHRRRARETINQILDHTFDDSRVRTPAEVAAGISPINPAYEPGDVRRYGAKLDGVTDDSAALTRALSQLAQGGRAVFIPTGILLIDINAASNLFTIPDGGVVYGRGWDHSEIRTTGTPSADRTILLVAAATSGTIQGLNITGPSSDGSGFCKGIRHAGTSGRLHVYDCWITQCTDAIKKDAGSACGIYVDNCRLTSLRSTGLLDVGETGFTMVNGTVFDTIGSSNLHHGIYFQSPLGELLVTGCRFRAISGYGVHCFGEVAGAPDGGQIVITGNRFSSNTTGDLIIGYTGDDVSTTISGNGFYSDTGVLLYTPHVAITGNTFTCATKCIDTTGGAPTDVVVSGNTFTNDRTAGNAIAIELADSNAARWMIVGNYFNQFVSASADIIRVHGATDISIHDNHFRLQGAFIRIRSSATRVSVKGNTATGTTGNTGLVYVVSTAADPCDIWIENNAILCSDRGASIEVDGVTFRNNRVSSSALTISSTKNFRKFDGNDGVGIVSPAQITAAQNDYSPTDLNKAEFLRLNSDASRNITGLAGGVAGRKLTMFNIGTQDIVLTNEDAASTAANRFALGANVTLGGGEACTLWYDTTSSRWRMPGKHV